MKVRRNIPIPTRTPPCAGETLWVHASHGRVETVRVEKVWQVSRDKDYHYYALCDVTVHYRETWSQRNHRLTEEVAQIAGMLWNNVWDKHILPNSKGTLPPAERSNS